MQLAMEPGGENEVGVWVSGFYGSGKSSFTKYLGLAFDERVQVDGMRFLKHLQDRMHKPQTKALLTTVASRYPAAVVMLDLASEMLAGATMEDVSTVLYYKVLQWAGYSRNLKVAALERRLKRDGRYDEFIARIESELGVPWCEVQNDPLVIDSLMPEIAHEMYPELFKTATSFNTETTDLRPLRERAGQGDARHRPGGDRQDSTSSSSSTRSASMSASRPNLILNLDGLAKNLKAIGDGKAWIIGTAQQTLTEDDPRAALNSPELYKLKDRFPIQIDLESSDIKEICYRRLLGKSPQGEQTLGAAVRPARPGAAPQHQAAGRPLLRRGLRQDDLRQPLPLPAGPFRHPAAPAGRPGQVHRRHRPALGDQGHPGHPDRRVPTGSRRWPTSPVGWLATTVTLYDALEKDIRRALPSIHKAVGKALIRFPDSAIHQEVAKTVAVLQILGNMPVTPQNVASLMHPGVEAPSRRDEVEAAVKELIADGIVPFGEKDGKLCFFSEKLNDIDQERAQIPLRTIETRRIQNEALREAFGPLPSARLHGTLTGHVRPQSRVWLHGVEPGRRARDDPDRRRAGRSRPNTRRPAPAWWTSRASAAPSTRSSCSAATPPRSTR